MKPNLKEEPTKNSTKIVEGSIGTHADDMTALKADYAAAVVALKVVEAKLGTMPTVANNELRNAIHKATRLLDRAANQKQGT